MKVLGVTCDNATANNAMIDELPTLIKKFAGGRGQVHCFAHVVNLVAKSILKQFDVLKNLHDHADEVLQELADLADDLNLEDRVTQGGQGTEDDNDDKEDNNIMALSMYGTRCLLWN